MTYKPYIYKNPVISNPYVGYLFGYFTKIPNDTEKFTGFICDKDTGRVRYSINAGTTNSDERCECTLEDFPPKFKEYIESNRWILDMTLENGKTQQWIEEFNDKEKVMQQIVDDTNKYL